MRKTHAKNLATGDWFSLKKNDDPRKACIVKKTNARVHVDFDSPKWFGFYNLKPTSYIFIHPQP